MPIVNHRIFIVAWMVDDPIFPPGRFCHPVEERHVGTFQPAFVELIGAELCARDGAAVRFWH